ncbi:MAG: IS21 family transposase [Dethiobacteria bacterium]|jgi:transposase
MHKIKEMIRLKDAGLSNRQIASSCAVSPSTVSEVIHRAEEMGLNWNAAEGLDEEELEKTLYPERSQLKGTLPEPDVEYIHRELRRKGVTLALLWEEYKEAHPDGYQYSYFCEIYQKWRGTLDVCMRQYHKAGEKTMVDYAGQTVPITDPVTGRVWQAHIFVAVLAATNYTFAMATRDESMESWITGHIYAFEFFGGLTELLVPDNPKAGVSKACRYEPELNRTYLELARHYGIAVIPARPRKPQDKAKVEKAVQLVENWILARLRNRTFFSLEELNQAIAKLLIELNNKPFQKLEGSRRSLFESLEKPLLKPLPEYRYEIARWKKARVNIDYHIEVEKNYYSVPYRLVKEQVEVRLTASVVEILHKGKRIASHQRLTGKGKFITLNEHRPKEHQKYLEWTPSRIIRWAGETGPQTAALVRAIIDNKPHPEQGYRACLGLIRLGQRYSRERLENACARAMLFDAISYRSVKSILEKGLDRWPQKEEAPVLEPIQHYNLRGSQYYDEKGQPLC